MTEILAEYDEVTSIHVYSVGPHPAKVSKILSVDSFATLADTTQDLALLSDVAYQVLNLQAADSSPSTRKIYGTILNPHVRRRERRGPGAKAAAVSIKEVPKPAAKPAPKPGSVEEKVKEEPKPALLAKQAASSSAPLPAKKPIPSLKKSNSGIMQAFSKAAAIPKKAKEPKPADTPMSDDGEDDEAMPQPHAPQSTSGRKSKKEREDELKRMMEDDDDEEEEQDEKEEESMEEAEEEAEEEPPALEPAKEEPKEVISATGDGRRRGKRRVTKKKQVMDEEGYLGESPVTICFSSPS